MTPRKIVPIPIVVAVVVVLFGLATQLQRVRDARYLLATVANDAPYVTSDSTLRRIALGYRALVADMYWIRTIQYYGGIKRRLSEEPADRTPAGDMPTSYDFLYPLLNIITTLDPRFNIAYRFGAIFLAEPFPGGAGRPDLAIALLQKGLREQPERWEYLQDIGFVHYWWLRDFKNAGAWFERAGDTLGAPWWLRSLAATTLSEGGDRQTSRRIWRELAQTPDNEWLRNDAQRRLRQLDALDQIDELQHGVDHLAGVGMGGWDQIVRAGALPGIPVDPSGVPYVLDATGRVRLSSDSPLFPLPDEPKTGMPLQ